MTTLNRNGSYRIAEPIETNTRAWDDTRTVRIERRMTKVVEGQIAVLRDATVDYIASELRPLRDEIKTLIALNFELEQKNAELERRLEQKSSVDRLVEDVVKRLDARQLARDESKRGKMGPQGLRGARGERGPPGARGPKGRPAEDRPVVTAYKNDIEHFKLIGYLSNGRPGPIADLFPFFSSFLDILDQRYSS